MCIRDRFTDGAPSGTCPVAIIRTYTIKDLCGNVSASLTQTISIDDTTRPVFTGTLAPITVSGCDTTSKPAALDVAGLILAGATISDACTPNNQLVVQFTDGAPSGTCLLYTSDAADERSSVDL